VVKAEFQVSLTADTVLVGQALTLSCVFSDPGNYSYFWTKSSVDNPNPLHQVGMFQEDCKPFGDEFRNDLYSAVCSSDPASMNLTIRNTVRGNDKEAWRCQGTSATSERAYASTKLEVHCEYIFFIRPLLTE